jgi:hypothetical protein
MTLKRAMMRGNERIHKRTYEWYPMTSAESAPHRRP